MTVTTTQSDASFDTNGVTVVFPFTFKFFYNEDLLVIYTSPQGVLSTLTLGIDYTVSGAGSESGGSVQTTTPLAGPGTLVVTRDIDALQLTSFRNQGKFLAETHEDAFDKLTMLAQQVDSRFSRALVRPIGANYYDAGGYRIANLGNPVNPQDGATKKWTNDLVAEVLQSGSGPINNAENVVYADPLGNITTVADALDGMEPFTHIYDVLVAYGQSNALGLAGNEGDTSGFPTMLPTSLMYDPDTNTIKPLIQNMKSVNGSVSSGHAWGEFANEYYRRTRRGLIVVNAARGGMAIAALSKGNVSGYYAGMINGAKAAVLAAAAAGLTVGARMVCWHQGETDQSDGTSFITYYSALTQLITDINTDWPISYFGICTVGCPLSRPETSWGSVQAAQRFVANKNSKAAIVFDGCPSFSIDEGMLNPSGSDEHYSQKAYNLMGFHAARGFAELFNNAGRVKSSADLAEYGGKGKVGAEWTRAERVSGLVFYHTTGWRLSSKDLSLNSYRTAGVVSAASNTNSLRIKLCSRADYIFETYVKVSNVASQNGITANVSLAVVGDDYFLDIVFYLDLKIAANLGNGSLFYGRPLTAVPTWISSFVTASLASNVLTLTHGSTGLLPMATHCGGSDTFTGQPAPVYVTGPSNSASRFSFGTGTQPSYPMINIAIDKMIIPVAALTLLSGFTCEFGATIAPLN